MKLKQLKEWVHQLVTESDYKVIKEIQLGEATVRLSVATDANFHNNIVQLVSNNGRIALDKKDMRALLTYIKTIMGYSYMPRLKKEGKSITLSKIQEGKLPLLEMQTMKEFYKYFDKFYGPKGLYPNKKGKLKLSDINLAVSVLLKQKPNHEFYGDSVDRESIRDILIKQKKLEPDYGKNEGLSEEKIMEGKMVKLPSGIKAELDTFKGLTLFTKQGKPIKFDRKELAMFLRSVGKHMGVR